MKRFIDACFIDGGTIETRIRKEKKKFLRIEMLVVRKEYQGQGYMRWMMDYAYALADERTQRDLRNAEGKVRGEESGCKGISTDTE